MAYLPVEIMETDFTRNVGCSDLPSDLGAALAAREIDPTPVVTRSGEVSRAESTSDMVTTHYVTRTGRPRNECCSGSRIPTGNRNPTGSK